MLDTAEAAIQRSLETQHDSNADIKRALTRVGREIENLLRAIETGAAPALIFERLHERERERTALQTQLAASEAKNPMRPADGPRIRRMLEEGLDRLGEVLASDHVAARQALGTILDGKVRFAPVEIGDDIRTYRFEAKLTLGRIVAATRQNNGDVPDGI